MGQICKIVLFLPYFFPSRLKRWYDQTKNNQEVLYFSTAQICPSDTDEPEHDFAPH